MTPLDRALLSLNGLAIGDAFGERFFGPPDETLERIRLRLEPAGPWPYTDDTEMALSVVEQLALHREIRQDELALRFAQRMTVGRGYGYGSYELLTSVRDGKPWRSASYGGFRGQGSFGNGAAMRVAPLGAFFAEDDLNTLMTQARLSAEVTHAHPEGIAGAIAVAVAARLMWEGRGAGPPGAAFLGRVLEHVPAGYTHDAIQEALAVHSDTDIVSAAEALGNGSGITAPDTVPLCLWVSAYANNFTDALWKTVSALGDRDTTCAIVGGLIALRVGAHGLPKAWNKKREPFPSEIALAYTAG
jgi:ADP-ribosylglycohydrolase